MRLALAQLNPLVGDLEGNGRLIEQAPAQKLLTAPASPLAQRLVARW